MKAVLQLIHDDFQKLTLVFIKKMTNYIPSSSLRLWFKTDSWAIELNAIPNANRMRANVNTYKYIHEAYQSCVFAYSDKYFNNNCISKKRF